ncbi:ribosome silencing factor [Enterococcus timonensis]|uniref:ribosome silencing factor n=1 Tax=Enterococcus timonensis TaxID=1852364 RepID=UPI0008D9CA34|nr:ribosome silencing factor [Enterococcus timonensis]
MTEISSEQILQTAVKAIDDKRGEDIVALDVRDVSLLADYFLIANGSSERQMNAIAENVVDQVGELGHTVKRVEGKAGGKWILIDLGDVIVHIFSKAEREFYNLEKLWSDAPMVNIDAYLGVE